MNYLFFEGFRNKRADITITILVMGVFVVCSLALASFFYSDFSIRDPSNGLKSMEKMNVNIEKYNSPFSDNLDLLSIETDVQGNKFFVLKREKGNKLLFQVKYYLN